MRNLSFYQRISQIFLRGILISLLPSLLYCSEKMEIGDHQAKSTVQIEPLLNTPIPTSNPPSSIGFMYSKILFYVDGEVPIEFPSHECVRVAHHVVESMKEEKPGFVPSYHSYNEQVEDSFQQFTDCIVSEAATFYNVDKEGLMTLLNLFYKVGPNFLFWEPNAFKLWNDIMTSIRLKKDNVVSFIKEDYDKHILPQQIIPQYSTSGWLGLARHIKKMEEPVSGWWIPLGNRLILLRNLPEERQHFYVSDHGSQEEVLYSTKKHLLIFTDEGRQEQLCSFLFWRFFAQLSRAPSS